MNTLIKKILLLFMMCALLPVAGRAQTPTDDTFTVSDLTWDGDMGGYYFIVSLNGSQIYTASSVKAFAFNFDAATGVEKTFNSPLDLGRLNLQELSTYSTSPVAKSRTLRAVYI